MKSALHCRLLLPGFARAAAGAPHPAPALGTLLRCASREAAGDDPQAWLCRLFGVARQQDWPVAPFSALGDGLAADSGYWLRADPVSLQLLRDSFSLAGAARGLRPAEAQQLVDALNAHFAPDGLRFFAPAADRWYLRLPQAPALQTHTLDEAAGRDIAALMPRGGDGLRWHRWLNEIQMLLHGHPLNLELERRAAPPVNSVWLWGGGILPAPLAPRGLAVWADDPLARGLALAHGDALQPLPENAQAWLERQAHAAASSHLVVLPAPGSLQSLERDWCAPLLAMLRAGRIARLTLHLAGERVSSHSVARADLCKFWRRAQPLEAYLG